MSVKKRFLLRMDQRLYDALEKWASDDLRSVNAQIEFLLGEALKRSGRFPRPPKSAGSGEETDGRE